MSLSTVHCRLEIGGVVTDDVIRATRKMDLDIFSVIAGLGGRPITKKGLKDVFNKAMNGELEELYFLDLDKELVEKQLKREKRRSSHRTSC